MLRKQSVLISAMVALGMVWCASGQETDPMNRRTDRAQLQHMIDALQSDVESAAVRQDRMEKELENAKETQRKLLATRSQLLAELDAASVSRESFEEVMRLLQAQRIQLSIDMAGFEARREAMMKLQDGTQTGAAGPRAEIAQKLRDLVQLQRLKLDDLKKLHDAGSVSTGELRDVERQLLEAEIRLAEFELPLNQAQLQEFQQELTAVSIERAEKTARLQRVEELLAQLVRSRTAVQSLQENDQRLAASYADQLELEQAVRAQRERMQDLLMKKAQAENLLESEDAKDQKAPERN